MRTRIAPPAGVGAGRELELVCGITGVGLDPLRERCGGSGGGGAVLLDLRTGRFLELTLWRDAVGLRFLTLDLRRLVACLLARLAMI